MDWKQSTPPHDAGALGNRGIKQGSSQHNLKKLLGKANSGELPYLMNTTGQADVSGLAPLKEKPPLLKETLLYADLFDLSPPHQPHQMRLFYDWSECARKPDHMACSKPDSFVFGVILFARRPHGRASSRRRCRRRAGRHPNRAGAAVNCCEQSGTGAGCNQGRNCPVRATRNAGVCTPEPDEQQGSDDTVVTITLIVAAYTVICGWLGYLWGTHGAAIEAFLWALAARLS